MILIAGYILIGLALALGLKYSPKPVRDFGGVDWLTCLFLWPLVTGIYFILTLLDGVRIASVLTYRKLKN